MIVARLTARQGEVLRLLCAGATTRQIATELGIAVVTVKNYRAQLRERLTPLAVAEGCVRLAEDDAAALGGRGTR